MIEIPQSTSGCGSAAESPWFQVAEGLGIGFTGGICVRFFFASAGNCESESLDAELANEDDDADGEAARDELFELDASPSLGEGMLALAEALSR